MGKISDAFNDAFRDYVISGMPSSGVQNPVKRDIRKIGPAIEDVVLSYQSGLIQVGSWAELNALSGRKAGQAGRVLGVDFGKHRDPISGKMVENIGEYSWNITGNIAGWQHVSTLSVADIDIAKAVRALTLRATKLALNGKIIVDKRGFFEGPAVYIPAKLFLGDSISTTEFYCELTPVASKLPGHFKVPIPAAFSDAIWVYFDAVDKTVRSAAWPERMPVDLSRYHHLITVYGNREGVSTDYDFVSTLDTTDCSFYLNTPAAFEAESMTLYIPRLYGWTTDGGFSLLPQNNETYRRISLPHSGEIAFVWLDISDILVNGGNTQTAIHITTGYDSKENPRPQRNGFRLALLGIVKNRVFTASHPDFRIVTPMKNQFGMGREDNDLADNIYSASTPVDLQFPEAKALGFTRGYQSSRGRPFYGGLFREPRRSGVIFVRFYAESDEENTFPAPSIYMQGVSKTGGALNKSFNAYLSRVISANVREYECFVTISDGNTYHSVLAGCYGESPLADKLRIFGVQFYIGPEDYAWISHQDYPRAANEVGARLRSLEKAKPLPGGFAPLLPSELFFHPERGYNFYPDQLFADTKRNQYDLIITSEKDNTSPLYTVECRANSFALEPEKLGQLADFAFINFAGEGGLKTVFNVKTNVLDMAAVKTIDSKILIIGDSLNDYNGCSVQSILRLRAMGAKVKTIGTITMKSEITGDIGSELGEARSGRRFSDYIYLNTDQSEPIADNVTAWNAYLALARTKRRAFNPFLKVPDAEDKKTRADMIYNGYIFDMRFYLERSGQPDPDLVDINLHTNDINHFDAQTAVEHIQKGLYVIVNQTRRALPQAKICIHYNSAGRFSDNARWAGPHWAGLKAVHAFIGALNDPFVFLIPNYCTINRDSGFQYEQTKTENGAYLAALSDGIHYHKFGLKEYGEVTAQFWAGALTT